MKSFRFFSDPSHGWLKVSVADAADLGLTPESFTPYSYRKGSNLYLEEDCDATLFVNAWEAKHGSKVALRESFTNGRSKIRSMERIHA